MSWIKQCNVFSFVVFEIGIGKKEKVVYFWTVQRTLSVIKKKKIETVQIL